MSCNLTEKAAEDLESIGDYIALDNPARAVTFIQEIRDTFSHLAEWPKSAPCRPRLGQGVRARPIGRYMVYYRVTADGVLIIRVLHSARDVGPEQIS